MTGGRNDAQARTAERRAADAASPAAWAAARHAPATETPAAGDVAGSAHEAGGAAPLRILQVNSGGKLFGGVSAFLYNVYSHIDRSEIQFDFLSPGTTTYGIHRAEIEAAGGRIFELHIKGNVLTKKTKLYAEMRRFLLAHPYRIIHINSGNFFFNLVVSRAARAAGVPVRIVHSHNAGDVSASKLKHAAMDMLKARLEGNATHLAACSRKAASYMFLPRMVESGRVRLIKNGIVPARFTFDEAVRTEVRREMGLGGAFVVGHAGRFLPQKNHKFLLSVFAAVLEREPEAVLLLLGDGPLLPEMKTRADELGIAKQVRFLGQRKDIERLYQAMDVFVLPSIHEGLPVVGVEVQAAGLPFVLSDTITEEVKICDAVEFLSLREEPARWAERILAYRGNGEGFAALARHDESARIAEAGYDIDRVAAELAGWYRELTAGSADGISNKM